MQIPSFWAEALASGEVKGRERTVRRFGWSSTSDEDARRHAEERAWAALLDLQAGRRVARRERKLAYGDEGLPIREEVIARNGDDVVTRNRYGARCLNEPDVWFGDVDLAMFPLLTPAVERAFSWGARAATAVGFAAMLAALLDGRPLLAGAALLIALAAAAALHVLRLRLRARPANRAAHRARAWQRIRDVVAGRPGTRLAVYETPAGLRLLAMHRTFDPRGDEAQALFRAFGCDAAYARLCRLQACFRTRVSAKPWRIGLPGMVPRALWPVPFERRDERDEWVETYEVKAGDFAACRFLEDLGDGRVDPRCAAVQRVHDELCRARSDLPLA